MAANKQCCLEGRLLEPAAAVWGGRCGCGACWCLCMAVTARMTRAWGTCQSSQHWRGALRHTASLNRCQYASQAGGWQARLAGGKPLGLGREAESCIVLGLLLP